MNRFIAGLSMMLWAAPLLGTEKTSEGRPAAPPLPRSEAVAFAQQLDKVVHFVAETYVKPVPHSALLLAALTGLHEAARLPVPPSLSVDAQNAKNEQQRLELIARIRQSLGDLPVLQGSKGIEVGVRAMCQVLDPYCQPVVLKSPRMRQAYQFAVQLIAPNFVCAVDTAATPGSVMNGRSTRSGYSTDPPEPPRLPTSPTSPMSPMSPISPIITFPFSTS